MSLPDDTVPAELARAFAAFAQNPALTDNYHRFSYGELSDFVAAFQSQMLDDGPVGIFGTPSALMGAAAVAAVVSGRPFVHLDPAMPHQVLTNIVDELAVGTIVTSQGAKPGQLPEYCRVITAESCIGLNGTAPLQVADVQPTDVIYLVATSGTTGRPKCIPVTHDAAFLSYRWRDDYTPYDPTTKVGIYIFAIWEMFRPLRNGSELFFPGINDLMSPQALAGFIAAHDLDEMLFTPSFYEKMLSGISPEVGAALPLKRVILNGEVVSDELIAEAQLKMPRVELWNLYSICETHDICMSRVGARLKGEVASVGIAMPHIRPIILDDSDQPCPVGMAGLLHFEGPRMLGPGYINRPEDTAKRFRTVTLDGEQRRLYDTGDQAYVDANGEIFVLGRIAHMLKLRGHSIQTRELVDTLAARIGFATAIPWVQQTADQGQVLVLYYTADAPRIQRNADEWGIGPGWQRMPKALADELSEVLPRYCIPTYLAHLDDIPLHPVSGKCDYRALPPVPQSAPVEAVSGHPAAIRHAASVLRCGVSEVDPQRSFHDQGGDSLMCVDLLMALEADYGRPVDFDWAMQLPLVRLHELLTQDASTPILPAHIRSGIFLTGATGFLGGHVLIEAARHLPAGQVIYCLIRPRNNEPDVRLAALLREHSIPEDRIALVPGTIDEPYFGLDRGAYDALASKVTSVIHCAAMVNLALGVDQMVAWSQSGISTILQFCKDADAPLAFSSSTAVFPDQGGPYAEAPALPFAGISGYGAAKLAAEAAIADSGITAAIVRLPSLYDASSPNPKDLYESIIAACAGSKLLPEGLCFSMTDVRAAARFLLHAAEEGAAGYFNLIADQPLRPQHYAGTAKLVPAADWLDAAPLSAPEARLIRENPTILHADAKFQNGEAKRLWDRFGLGPFAQLCDAEALLTRRFAYHKEPAFT